MNIKNLPHYTLGVFLPLFSINIILNANTNTKNITLSDAKSLKSRGRRSYYYLILFSHNTHLTQL